MAKCFRKSRKAEAAALSVYLLQKIISRGHSVCFHDFEKEVPGISKSTGLSSDCLDHIVFPLRFS